MKKIADILAIVMLGTMGLAGCDQHNEKETAVCEANAICSSVWLICPPDWIYPGPDLNIHIPEWTTRHS